MNQIRVLHCNNDNKNMGGAYLVERKLDPYMRQYGYVFDYITMDEFVKRGVPETDPLPDSLTYSARLRRNRLIGHILLPFYVRKVLKAHPYQIVHIDIDLSAKALLYALPAKWSGAKVLAHSHASGIDGEYKWLKGLLHCLCKKVLAKYVDQYIACSQQALKWLCPEDRLDNADLLYNGINSQEFFYDPAIRERTRQEFGVVDRFVLINVGRINTNKNQIFLVDVLREIQKEDDTAVLMLVGPYAQADYDVLMKKVNDENLVDSVIVVGETNEVNKYLNAADYFILPSVFEGLSLASVEAQRTGLHCLLSSGTPPEVKFTESATRAELLLGAKEWAKIVLTDRKCKYKRASAGLNKSITLEGMAEHLAKIYARMIGS